VRLLREVKYIQLLDKVMLPKSALDIYDQRQVYREQIVSLEMIIESHNYIMTCLHAMEEPLIKQRIERMEEIMRPGIDTHTWKNSDAITGFINEAKGNVDELH
jgi:hypothetical protein